MKILALEISTSRGSIALLNDGCVAREFDWPNDRRDSAPFFQALNSVVGEFTRADKIVVGLGPGSYAGTRIAISTAVGLEFAWDAALIGYPSICALEVNVSDFWVTGDARRQSYFVARIRNGVCVEGPTLCTRDELETRLVVMSDAAPVYSSEQLNLGDSISIAFPTARKLGELALRGTRRSMATPLEPMYLREPHITRPRTKPSVTPR